MSGFSSSYLTFLSTCPPAPKRPCAQVFPPCCRLLLAGRWALPRAARCRPTKSKGMRAHLFLRGGNKPQIPCPFMALRGVCCLASCRGWPLASLQGRRNCSDFQQSLCKPEASDELLAALSFGLCCRLCVALKSLWALGEEGPWEVGRTRT